MTKEELCLDLLAARPGPDDLIYIERREDTYAWSRPTSGAAMLAVRSGDGSLPNVWLYYTGRWPVEDAARWRAFCDDLLDEMEAMAGGADRCRWPLDGPWPHEH